MIKLILILNFLISLCLSQFLIRNTGPCSCDFTANVCDVGCCCDTSCPTLPAQVSGCANSLISPVHGCVPSAVVFANNAPFSVSNVDGQMCIYRDDYSLRNFYVAPNLNRNDVSGSADLPVSYPSFQGISAVLNTYGSTIYTFRPVGFLATSRAGGDGSCVDGLPVGYLVNEDVQCVRPVVNINTECASLPGTNVYLQSPDLLVAASPQSMNLQFNYSTNLTGTGYFITPSYTCNNSPSCTPVAPSPSGATCTNVVTAVSIVVSGDSANITAVAIALTVATVAVPITQRYQVIFNKTGFSPATAQFSGAPGYLVGRPLVTRFANSTNGVWSVSASGDCVNGSRVPVLFGQGIESACLLSDPAQYLASLNSTWPAFVAPYGNSVAFSAPDWAPVVAENAGGPGAGVRLGRQAVTVLFARDGTLSLPQNKVVGVRLVNEWAPSPPGSANGSASWLAISVSFLDVSQPPYDVGALAARRTSGRSVLEFLYLFQVEAASSAPWPDSRLMLGALAVLAARTLLAARP